MAQPRPLSKAICHGKGSDPSAAMETCTPVNPPALEIRPHAVCFRAGESGEVFPPLLMWLDLINLIMTRGLELKEHFEDGT